VDRLRIDPHLDRKPDTREFRPAVISVPLDPPDKGAELVGDLIDRRFKMAAGFF
jgi:hypothetical protein